MRVVIAIDDSPHSKTVVDNVCNRTWSEDTQFLIVMVLEPVLACGSDERASMSGMMEQIKERRRHHATELCNKVREKLREHIKDSIVAFDVREGSPKSEILDAALEWSADRILMGAHGQGLCPRFLLGSVSAAVAAHAPCTVEIIRDKMIPAKNSRKSTELVKAVEER